MNMISHIKAPRVTSSSYLEEERDFNFTSDGGSGQTKFTVQVFPPVLLQSRGALCVKLPFNADLPISEGHKHVEKDLQYLGKLCSICPSNSPSTATILQESLKAHY